MSNPPLILASTSPARRALMDALGVPYRAVAPEVDEPIPPGRRVEDVVLELAHLKANAVSRRCPEALVLGADQLVSAGGEILRKPESLEEARAQLELLCGRVHKIVTGVCLLGPRVHEQCVDVVQLATYALSPEERERYLALGEWQGCAGGYRIESAGQALFSDIQGDRTSIQGLPMLQVVRLLRSAGVPFFTRQ